MDGCLQPATSAMRKYLIWNPYLRYSTKITPKWCAYWFFVIFSLVLEFIYTLGQLGYIITAPKSLGKIAQCLGTFVIVVYLNMSNFLIIYEQKSWADLIDDIEEVASEIYNRGAPAQREFLKSTSTRYQFLGHTFQYMTLLMGASYLSCPVLYNYFVEPDASLPILTLVYIPFEMDTQWKIAVVYFTIVFGIVHNVLFYAFFTNFLASVLLFTNLCFLGFRKNLTAVALTNGEDKFNIELIQNVVVHQKLFRLCSNLECVMNDIMLLRMISGLLASSLLGLQVFIDLKENLRFLILPTHEIIQLLILCWVGHLIMDQSSGDKSSLKQHIIVRSPHQPQRHNRGIQVRPIVHHKGVSCKPQSSTKETQTDDELGNKTPIIVPIPVPIYVPAPMCMYSAPAPVPVPFPLPIPVPIFIPTTRNSTKGIMKEIKRIQEKIPADPFEAELLMMAEMVASEKKENAGASDSEEGEAPSEEPAGAEAGNGVRQTYSPEAVDTSTPFGEDIMQMALKLASTMDEQPVDFDSAVAPSTIVSGGPQAADEEESDSDPDDPDTETKRVTRKRAARAASRSSAPSKRSRRVSSSESLPVHPPSDGSSTSTKTDVEKPDANMALKYMYGVNAWRHWVLQKNAQLEKAATSNRKLKLFKTDLLRLTADELNYSLCLFVKEVRKPNGAEYAPDTIYYLCLGIQLYLIENGRVDNIFSDPFYDKFTECLDEISKKFSTLYDDTQFIVTRVEEEHLWEAKQLGAHSPHVLLSTLMFFNTKHFNITTVDEHMLLSFSHIMKHWKRNNNASGSGKNPGRNVLLRFYPSQAALESNSQKKKVYEQSENEDDPLRCPVKLYEFYLSKCPESVKTRNDVFYLQPERSCVPDSPVWYSTMSLNKETLLKMLRRVKMVKEINVAILK